MIRPLRNGLTVRLDDSLPNAAGIHLAANTKIWREAQDQIGNRGTVVRVGPGKVSKRGFRLPMRVALGDVVRFSELEYPTFQENGLTFVVISEMDVEGIEVR